MPEVPRDRVYSEEEISRILKRAADMQGKQSRRPVLGLSLPELQQLARESDIDPVFIEAAALELSGTDVPDEEDFFGGPLTVTIRRRIEGHVSEDAFNRMVSEARRRFKKAGKTSAVGATREWSTENERDSSASFSLRERAGHTEIEIFWTESEILPIPFIFVPIMLTVVSLPVWIEGLELTGIVLAAAIAMVLLAAATGSRTAFRAITARHRRQVRGFGDTLVEIAQQEQLRNAPVREPVSPSSESVAAAEPRITLDEPGEPDADPPDRDARSRTR